MNNSGRVVVFCFLFLALGCNSTGASFPLTGEVIKIADGDTLTILTADKEKIRVRLTENVLPK